MLFQKSEEEHISLVPGLPDLILQSDPPAVSAVSRCTQAPSYCISVWSLIAAPKILACDLLKNKCVLLCREMQGWERGNF